jgi:hypothetical protein
MFTTKKELIKYKKYSSKKLVCQKCVVFNNDVSQVRESMFCDTCGA